MTRTHAKPSKIAKILAGQIFSWFLCKKMNKLNCIFSFLLLTLLTPWMNSHDVQPCTITIPKSGAAIKISIKSETNQNSKKVPQKFNFTHRILGKISWFQTLKLAQKSLKAQNFPKRKIVHRLQSLNCNSSFLNELIQPLWNIASSLRFSTDWNFCTNKNVNAIYRDRISPSILFRHKQRDQTFVL